MYLISFLVHCITLNSVPKSIDEDQISDNVP